MAGRHTNSAESGSGWDWRKVLIPLVVVLGVIAGIVAFANSNSKANGADNSAGERGHSSSSGSPAPVSSTSDGAGGGSSGQPDALAGCVRLFQRQLAATQAANASLDQWKLHIKAMNQLVAGKITLQQASKFWAQTRMGAIHKVQAFERMRQKLSGLNCQGEASSGTQLNACQRATAAYGEVVKSAHVTIDTWNKHIQEMEDLAAGRITPTQALQMWHHMWHMGQRQLRHYHQTLEKAQHQTCAA